MKDGSPGSGIFVQAESLAEDAAFCSAKVPSWVSSRGPFTCKLMVLFIEGKLSSMRDHYVVSLLMMR